MKKNTIGTLAIVILLMIAIVDINPVEARKHSETSSITDSLYTENGFSVIGGQAKANWDFWWCDGNKWCWKE